VTCAAGDLCPNRSALPGHMGTPTSVLPYAIRPYPFARAARAGRDRDWAASAAIALAVVGSYLPALVAGPLWLAVLRRVGGASRPIAAQICGSEARRAASGCRHLVGQQAELDRLPGRPRPGGCCFGCFSGLCAKLLAIGQHELCGVGVNRGVSGCGIASADRTQGLTGAPACRGQW